MDALQGAILRAKLPHLDSWTAARQRNATLYRQYFLASGLASDDSDGRAQLPVILPVESGWGRHIYHLFQIRALRRDALQNYLKTQGISTEVYYPVPLHLQACFADMGYAAGDYPNAERAASETLALPIYPELTEAMIARVVDTVQAFFRQGLA